MKAVTQKLVIFRPLQHFPLPKSPLSDHNRVDKNSIEQNIEQCQHPGEGTHIHVVEQVRSQGMKTQRTKQRNTSQQQKLQTFTRQYRATIQRAIPVKKTQLSLSNRKNRSTPTSATIQQRNSQLNIR